jgi:hypothetical protein
MVTKDSLVCTSGRSNNIVSESVMRLACCLRELLSLASCNFVVHLLRRENYALSPAHRLDWMRAEPTTLTVCIVLYRRSRYHLLTGPPTGRP